MTWLRWLWARIQLRLRYLRDRKQNREDDPYIYK
jgi:hypothetical protein